MRGLWEPTRRSEDRGAYAVLYALLIVVFIGLTSLVIDLGMLRMDRRANRAAADAAAVAGSAALGRGGNDPVKACQQAMRYAEINLNTVTGSDNCGSVFGGPITCTAATTTETATETVDGRTITISWPIHDGDPLLTDPDRERSPGSLVSQPTSSRDGDPCQRIAVQITQNRQLAFAAIWSWSDVTTNSHSVGLADEGGRGGSISPLIALEPTACNALRVDNAALTVNPAVGDLNPGEISVDSDGTGTGCSPGSAVSLANGTIDALGTASGAPGHIYTLEDTPSYPGCTPLCPTPEHRADPVTEAPWRDRYNCDDAAAAGCANKGANNANLPSPHDYVDRWDGFDPSPPFIFPPLPNVDCVIDNLQVFNSDTRCNVNMDIAGTGDVTVNGDLVIANDADLLVRGNLVVNGRLFVADQVVVFSTGSIQVSDIAIIGNDNALTEDVRINAGGRLWIGNALAVDDDLEVNGCFIISQRLNDCAGWSPDTTPTGANDAMGVEIGGDLRTGVSGTSASIIMDQAFVRVDDALTLNAPSGRIVLVAPYAEQAADCDPSDAYGVPNSACFEDLALWADANVTGPRILAGNADTYLDGTIYVPNMLLQISGDLPQQTAQLVADRITVLNGELNLVGDASRSTLVPRSGGSLIR